MNEYRSRIIDSELQKRLTSAGAVIIEGPKACGKTESARQVAKSEVFLDTDDNARQALALDPGLVLDGEVPRLIDEWQVEPSIWNHLRREVDERRRPGQFILTGSATPDDDMIRHTGAGRFSRLRMRPMSLFESGHSDGAISLRRFFDGEDHQAADSSLDVHSLVDRLIIGGWPASLRQDVEAGAQSVRDYVEQIQLVDVARVGGARRDPLKIRRLMQSVARHVATEVASSTLAADAGGSDGPMSHHTINGYLDALERLMIIENQPAWSTSLRSRVTLRNAPKRHFVDPSIAVAVLGAGKAQLLAGLDFLGFFFESLVVRDLRVYSQPLDGNVYHYRDSSHLEVDAIVELRDGRWGAFEVKLASSAVDNGAATLRKFVERIDTDRVGQPSILGVITLGQFGYKRKDGIFVVPIGSFGP